eukprot:3359195-Alexandrium_andersonii.AAC.1
MFLCVCSAFCVRLICVSGCLCNSPLCHGPSVSVRRCLARCARLNKCVRLRPVHVLRHSDFVSA